MSTTCISLAQGVPGQPGAPNWYDNTAAPPRPFDQNTDDPRWRGALSHAFGSGSDENAQFRALNFTEGGVKSLYLSWIINAGPAEVGVDQVLVGFSTGPGSAAIIAKIVISSAATTIAGTSYTTEIFVKPAADTNFPTGASAAADPAWLANTRVWVNYAPKSSPPINWAVQMVVPLGSELSPEAAHSVVLPDSVDFKMWYAMYLGTVVTPSTVEYPWPNTPGISGGYPQVSQFEDVRAANNITDPACTTEGITIEWSGIGTRDVDGTARASASRIQLDLTNDPPTADDPNEQNMFFAQPIMPAGITAARKTAIRARFRLANWGTHVGDLTPDSWTNVPGGDAVQFDNGAASQECHFIWPVQADLEPVPPDTTTTSLDLIKKFRTGALHDHVCMLVELFSVFPTGETFTKSSVYRNMDVVNASVCTRVAVVSVQGLEALSSQPREVYLYVETRNMPATVRQDDDREEREDREGKDRGEGNGRINYAHALKKGFDSKAIAKVMPTYRVHGYHDTGRTTKLLDGTERKILRPQTSFGYFVNHEGALYGWQHNLEGSNLVQLSDNFYLIPVPNNGTAEIRTTIEAIENRGCMFVIHQLWQSIKKALGL